VNSPVVLTARALLFDMDGTLIDSTAVVESVWARFATRYGIDVREILKTSHGRQMVDTVRRWAPAGTDIAAECLELSSFEITQTEGIVSLPGASSFANALPRQTRALVTSAPRELAVARMSLAGFDLPDVVITADDVERGKPDPSCYLLAAERLGVSPADAVVFEDAEAGLRAGLAAGMRCVVVGDLQGDVTRGLPRVSDYARLATSTTLVDGHHEVTATIPPA
jgi:sugar-phosphatase